MVKFKDEPTPYSNFTISMVKFECDVGDCVVEKVYENVNEDRGDLDDNPVQKCNCSDNLVGLTKKICQMYLILSLKYFCSLIFLVLIIMTSRPGHE